MSASHQDGQERPVSRLEIVAFLGIGLLLEILQGALLPGFLHIQVVLLFVVYISWHSHPMRGAVSGTFFGIAQDYLLGTLVGLNGLSKSMLGFLSSYLSRWTAPDLGLLRAVLLGLLALTDRGLVVLTLLLLGQSIAQLSLLDFAVGAALTGFVGEVFFRLYDRIRFPPKDFRRL